MPGRSPWANVSRWISATVSAMARLGEVARPKCSIKREDQFGIRGAASHQVQVIGQTVFQASPDAVEVPDLTIVHETPDAMCERVAIGCGGFADVGGADMCQKALRADMPRDAGKIFIGPGRCRVSEQPGFGQVAVPGDAKAVAVDRDLGLACVSTLSQQRMRRGDHHVLKPDRPTQIGRQPTHQRVTMRRCMSRIRLLAVFSNRQGISAWIKAAVAAPNSLRLKPRAKAQVLQIGFVDRSGMVDEDGLKCAIHGGGSLLLGQDLRVAGVMLPKMRLNFVN